MNLATLYSELPRNAHVLDVGCFGFGQVAKAKELNRSDLRHAGVDYCEPQSFPAGFDFRKADLNREPIPFPDDTFDLVVASHIIEHLDDGVVFFGECLRVLKPGGLLYVEAPSERSLWLPSMPYQRDSFFSLSFFDDPTHRLRPWPPQALHRLTLYYGCEPLHSSYIQSWKCVFLLPVYLLNAWLKRSGSRLEGAVWGAIGWACYLIAKKPESLSGKPPFFYYIPKSRP